MEGFEQGIELKSSVVYTFYFDSDCIYLLKYFVFYIWMIWKNKTLNFNDKKLIFNTEFRQFIINIR